ncbi:MAG: oxidoreductase [Verrucomicrobia bacterium]|nr:oxidoreductase [Verrucomicrobiota bacterium]MCH8512990.1 oxidoreductase [Kiritimatiellia bacterium]
MNLTEYDISHPYTARVVHTNRITPEDTDEVRHIVLNIDSATFNYLEGQSIGVLVPGPHSFGNQNHMRLYSIANSRQGEEGEFSEVSICVRRCFYIDEVSGEKYPGVASNYLCDARPGDEILIAGPYGRQFMPPKDPSCNILMIGVGTGIAPFRAFLKHIYEERKQWKGQVRLFYGARTGMDLLYMNDKNKDLALYYDQDTFKAVEALSPRPVFDEPADIGRSVEENAEEVWGLLQDSKTHVYVSGLSKLEDQLDQALAKVAGSEETWLVKKGQLIEDKRWKTLFYK